MLTVAAAAPAVQAQAASARRDERGHGDRGDADILGPDGTTAPVFRYTAATRERVFIP